MFIEENGKINLSTETQDAFLDLPESAYEVLNPEALHAIMTDLSVHHELPLRFSYLHEGAARWDKTIMSLSPERQADILPDYDSIMESFWQRIGQSPVNIIDLGPGNGLQAKELISELEAKNQLNAYVAADISSEMLDIAVGNVRQWTHPQTPIITHVKDFIQDPINDILADERLGTYPRIILALGGTLDNGTSPVDALRTFSQLMWPNDLLLYDALPPTGAPSSHTTVLLSPRHSYIPDLLGIQRNLYRVERTYDATTHTRLDQIVPKANIKLTYKLHGSPHTIILKKATPITVWRYRYMDFEDAVANLKQGGLNVVAASEDKLRRNLLFMCERRIS